ncbi:MAG: hypothetical protein Q8L77_05195 [Nitrospirota bacterium]|nr:hypothetical protein [Nitrospirota bacterium]
MIPSDKIWYGLKRGEDQSIDFRGTKMTVKVPGAELGESYSMIEMVHPPKGQRHGATI